MKIFRIWLGQTPVVAGVSPECFVLATGVEIVAVVLGHPAGGGRREIVPVEGLPWAPCPAQGRVAGSAKSECARCGTLSVPDGENVSRRAVHPDVPRGHQCYGGLADTWEGWIGTPCRQCRMTLEGRENRYPRFRHPMSGLVRGLLEVATIGCSRSGRPKLIAGGPPDTERCLVLIAPAGGATSVDGLQPEQVIARGALALKSGQRTKELLVTLHRGQRLSVRSDICRRRSAFPPRGQVFVFDGNDLVEDETPQG